MKEIRQNIKKIWSIMFLGLLLTLNLQAQEVSDFEDMEAVAGKGFFKEYVKGMFKGFTAGDPLALSGGIGLNVRTYDAWGLDELRQPPFYWVMNANVNIQIYQLNIPFSALISIDRREVTAPPVPGVPDVKERFTNRFNRIGASPYYKWIKMHFGHRNMDFSQFTLSNLTYLGAGVELTPGKVRVAAMYGKLADAEPRNLSLTEPNLAVFERTGFGVKLGYGTDQSFLDVIFFKGWDDKSSIPTFDPQDIFPKENLVVGLKGQVSLFEKFVLKGEVAGSALTPNLNDNIIDDSKFPYPQFLLEPRFSTTYRQALETGIDYNGQGYTLGIGYRRIDPGYKTLGAYFFNNDIEDITGRASWALFGQQVQFNVSAGVQKDNLDDSKTSTLTRFIGSADVNWTKDKFNLGLNYSNYSSDIQYVIDTELDSLNVVVVTQDLGLTASYMLPSKEATRQTITASVNMQNVNDDVINAAESGESKMFNANLIYSVALTETNWGFNVNWNYNTNELAMTTVNRIGGGFGITKSLMENKINLGLNLNYFRASIDAIETLTNKTLNVQFQANYAVNEHHNFFVNYALLNRVKEEATVSTSFSEGIGNFGYQYNFGWKPGQKKAKEAAKKELEKAGN